MSAKWDGPHKHKCPDCGVEFDCPINNPDCGCEYGEYPCRNHMMNHVTIFYSNPPTERGEE